MVKKINIREFIGLMALLMALPALAIDAILPALSLMKDHFHVASDNQIQFVIGSLFLGLTVGQLFFGPIADSFGRKNGISGGLFIFILGTLLCLFSFNFPMMLAGRFLQGFGASATRVICVAIARDLYKGRDMARIMSFIMAVFIFVPTIAPALGQTILMVSQWRWIFVLYLIVAVVTLFWMLKRLPETLKSVDRRPFSPRIIFTDFLVVMRNRTTLGYAIAAGFIFASFTGYLVSAQQIFQNFYNTGEMFSVYFGLSALSIGVGSWGNGMLVKRFGMNLICMWALCFSILVSLVFFVCFSLTDPSVSFVPYMIYTATIFFCQGFLFGNLNALAIEPMGKHAGVASAIIGSLSSAIAVVGGTVIGQLYNHTLIPLVLGFLCFSILTLCLHIWLGRNIQAVK